MNRPGLLMNICLTAIVAASCSASSKKLDLGGTCVQNSDCNNPLACKFATCHQQCVQSRDCPTGQQCVAAADGSGVCQTPAEACGSNGKACPSPLVCVSNTCVNVCPSGLCPLASQTCIGGTCQDTQVAGNDGSAGAGVGVACALSSDCASSLLCKFGSCHQACTSSTDCASGGRCVTANGVAVCQIPAEAACGAGGTCAVGLACRTVDNTCRSACTSSAGCLSGQTCAGTVCVENAESNPGNDGSAGAGDGSTTGGGGSTGSTGGVAINVPSLGKAFNYTQGSYLIGFKFRANSAITIAQLGFWDSNLTSTAETFMPVPVGLYDLSTHALLGSATVHASDPATGFFRYVSLATPIALNTTDTYAVVGVSGTNYYAVGTNGCSGGFECSHATVSTAITFLGGACLGASCLTTTNALAEPTDTETWANFGANFMFATGSGGSDAGIDAPITSVGDAATGSGGSGGSAGGATGPSGRDSGTAGASGTACTPGQAPTNFGNVATSDSNTNYTSGVGLLTATEFLIFNGYVGPDATDGGVVDGATATLVNRIDVQHFDPISGKKNGSATPLLAAGGDGTGLYINGADIAPTGEIAIIYSVQRNSVWGMFLTFLDKNLAPKKTTQFLAWGSTYPVSSHVKWLNGEFVASSMVYNPGLNATIKLGKFGADGSNAGNINALPTDDPSNGAHDACLADGNEGEGEVAFSGGLFAVGYLSLAKITPYLTILDASGAAVGSPISLQSTNPDTRLISMAGTLNGFVTIYNGHSSSGAWALLATYVSNSASGSISASGDAGVPLGATYAFPGSGAVGSGGGGGCSDGQTCGSSDGTGAGFAVLYPNGSVSFLYFGEDGSPRGQEQTVLYELKAYDADKVQVTNFGGTFAVSLYSYATHSTQVVATTCQ